MPGLVVQLHVHQDVAREELPRRRLLAALDQLDDLFRRHQNVAEVVLLAQGLDALLERGLRLVLVARIGMYHVPRSPSISPASAEPAGDTEVDQAEVAPRRPGRSTSTTTVAANLLAGGPVDLPEFGPHFLDVSHRPRHRRRGPYPICSCSAMSFLRTRERVRQGSNLQPPDLESGALPIRATDPTLPRSATVVAPPRACSHPALDQTLPSLCRVWVRHDGAELFAPPASRWSSSCSWWPCSCVACIDRTGARSGRAYCHPSTRRSW